MRKLIAFLALLLVLLTSAAHLFAQDRPSLLEVLQNDPDGRFTSLLAAIDAAGLTDALSGDGPYTLLAPTNDAFAASLEAMGMTAEQAMADTDTLSKIIRYHIVPGRYLFHSLTTGATLGTALAGERVTFALDSGVFSANGIEISDPDNIGSNGVMHVLEGVLIPASVQEALAATPEPTPEPTAAATPEVGVAPGAPICWRC
ncbi:MAG: fasciclin domain-containing protein [Anaerolineae bacterium]